MRSRASILVPLFAFACVAAVALSGAGCGGSRDEYNSDGRLIIEYWEKWNGFELDAMQAVVDEYNKSQDRYFVRLTPTSQIDRKLLVSVAGGDPPDVAGIWTWAINIYGDKNALTPLDDYVAAAGLRRDSYIPAFWDLCSHRGHVYGLPSTVATLAIHWNKRLFRQAGLDPEKPPRTLREYIDLNDRLTVYQLPDGTRKSFADLGGVIPADGKIVQMGFLPFEPDWYLWIWGHWFGGKLWDGSSRITWNEEGNLEYLRWFDQFLKRYGPDKVNTFYQSFRGLFASSENAFMSGRVAMVLQGVWMYNFIDKYSKGMDWGVCPVPYHDGSRSLGYVEADVLVVPKGARHPEAAFDFIRFVQTQPMMELLAMGQRKFSPLRDVTDSFYAEHPHPYIRIFREIAEGDVFSTPAMGIWNEYQREIYVAVDSIRLQKMTPEAAAAQAQERLQRSMEAEMERLRRRGKL